MRLIIATASKQCSSLGLYNTGLAALQRGGQGLDAVDKGDDILTLVHGCGVEVAACGELVQQLVPLKEVTNTCSNLLGRLNVTRVLDVAI